MADTQAKAVLVSSDSAPEASYSAERPIDEPKPTLWQRTLKNLRTPGSATQIVIAACTAVAIGVSVSATVEKKIPEAVPPILEIPGQLWLRALRATVLPLIICAIISCLQNLKEMAKKGKKLAMWTVGWYLMTTLIAVVHSMIMVDLVWVPLLKPATAEALRVDEADRATIAERSKRRPHDIVVELFENFVPTNIVLALTDEALLSILVVSIVVGMLIKGPAERSPILRAVQEVEAIVAKVIVFLIKLAPIGVFFLIVANMFTLDIKTIGLNLGILIGSNVAGIALHLFIVLPLVFFLFTRENPFIFWFKVSPAWITAWGTSSSAATLPVTMRCLDQQKVPRLVSKFVATIGCMMSMDGTAIGFPLVVVWLAATQGIQLNAGDYTLIVILSTIAAIAASPIPSSGLVLTVMIANSVNIPITGMYAVIVAIDWLLDRFQTTVNVSVDLYCARVMQRLTGIQDEDATDLDLSDVQSGEMATEEDRAQEKRGLEAIV